MSKGWHYETLSQSLGTSGLKRMVMIISTAKLMLLYYWLVMSLLKILKYFNCASYQICIIIHLIVTGFQWVLNINDLLWQHGISLVTVPCMCKCTCVSKCLSQYMCNHYVGELWQHLCSAQYFFMWDEIKHVYTNY